MSSRKVYVVVETRLIIDMDENIKVADVVQEMDYDFIPRTAGADIVDTEIKDYNIEDSK